MLRVLGLALAIASESQLRTLAVLPDGNMISDDASGNGGDAKPGDAPVAEVRETYNIWLGAEDHRASTPAQSNSDSNSIQLIKDTQEVAKCAEIQILGMFDSGTNLLQQLMLKNLASLKMSSLTFEPAPRGGRCGAAGIWKHFPPEELDRSKIDRYLTSDSVMRDFANTKVVAIVRSPAAQLIGWQKAGYNIKKCTTKGMHDPPADWITRQCTWRCTDQELDCPFQQGTFHVASVVEQWNAYGRGYRALTQQYPHMVILKYEDLVLEPEAAIGQVATIVDDTVNRDFEMVESSAKTHGGSHGRDEAIQDISEHLYLQHLTKEERTAICARVDGELLSHFGYELDCEGCAVGTLLGVAGDTKTLSSSGSSSVVNLGN